MSSEGIRLTDEPILNFSYNRFQAYGVYDSEERIVGAIVLHPYPNVPSVSPCYWEEWFHNVYGMKTIDSRNSMWIHLALYDPMYLNFFFIPLLQGFFKDRFMIKYCLMIIPPGIHNTEFFNNIGVAVLPKGGKSYKSTLKIDDPRAIITCCYKYNLCPLKHFK